MRTDPTVLLAAILVSLGASSTVGAQTSCSSIAQTYATPGKYSFVAPPGCTSVLVRATGAGGGGMWEGTGGRGGYVEGTVTLTPGATYWVIVGQGGRGTDCGGGTPGGGGGGHTSLLDASGIPILSAGGGGGGHRYTSPCDGGAVCSLASYLPGGAGFGAGGQESDTGPISSDGRAGTGWPEFAGGRVGQGNCGSSEGFGGFGGGGGGGGTNNGYGGGGGGGGYPGGAGGASGKAGQGGANQFDPGLVQLIVQDSSGASGGTGLTNGGSGALVIGSEVLVGSPGSLSLSAGGTQTLNLDLGAGFASKVYIALGSLSGTQPGIPYGAVLLPLNPDPYLFFTANVPNSPLLSSSLGTLDAFGQATILFSLPAGTPAALVGLTANHAAVTIEATGALSAISNPVPCQLLP